MKSTGKTFGKTLLVVMALGGCGSAQDDTGHNGDPAPADDWVPDYFPTDGWREQSPEALGFDPEKLRQALEFAADGTTEGLMIVQDGYVVAEVYFEPFTAETRHESYSVAKSFTSALVGIAIGDGLLEGVDQRICEFYAEWDCDAAQDPRSRITLHHAMTLSTGLEWNESWSAGSSPLDNDAVQMSTSGRPIDYVLAKPAAHEPGSYFQYSTGDPALLSGVIQAKTGKTALDFAEERIFSRIGASGIVWRADADGRTTTFAGLQATVQDYARFGFLYLNRGRWDDQSIVPSDWVDASTRSGVSLEPWYGYLWHVNLPVRFEDPALPADGYTAQGVAGQFVTVIPSERLVIVRVANDGIFAAEYDLAGLLRRILDAKR